jgi:iron complex outermembrane receptor protein
MRQADDCKDAMPGTGRPRLTIRCTRAPARVLLAVLLGTVITAAATEEIPDDLMNMSLEALMNVEVTSVSKKPEKQTDAAAAIFVITNADLQRWGVTSIPEALRRVPGLYVARIDANKWAITSRGFNSRFANKLLVLIDGRSVYTPLFAGVYWDMQEVMLEDVDRIEVIRGPGGTLWGANAVNGVINIITRSAAETRGGLVSATAGNEIPGIGSARHGGKLHNGGDYRIYAQYQRYAEGYNPSGAHDDWRTAQVGFRSDWASSPNDAITLQGDLYQGKAGQQVIIPAGNGPTIGMPAIDDTDSHSGNLLFRWSRDLDADANYALQVYYDHVGRDGAVLFEDRDTLDIDFQHRLPWGHANDLIWGFGYRYVHDNTDNNPTFSLIPASRNVSLYSTFIQNEVSLTDDLRLTLGSKFEHNDFSGYETQPNARIAWSPEEAHTLWGAISRATRTPARGEHDVKLRMLPVPDPGVPVYITGDDQYGSEDVLTYEAGYRFNYLNRWSLDVTAFYNDYDELRTQDPVTSPPADILLDFDNNMTGETWGLELAGQWQVRPGWRLNLTYTWLDMALHLDNGSMDHASQSAEDASPTNSATFWSTLDLGNRLQFDSALRYMGAIEVNGIDIDSYAEVDLRLGWEATPGLEISLIGQNLLENHHREFLPDFISTQPTEVERSIYGRVTWRL